MMTDMLSKMGPTEWITLMLGMAALGGTIWSNITAHKALRISGKQRVAEFRKEWLEALRSDVADLMTYDQSFSSLFASVEDIKIAIQNAQPTFRPVLEQKALELIGHKDRENVSRVAAASRIFLRLIDDRELNGELSEAVKLIIQAKNPGESTSARATLVTKARNLFKSEWDKLSTEMKT